MRKVFQVILADDDTDDHFLFLKVFDSLTHDTSIISILGGNKLMHYLCQNLDKLPDIIFLDLHMPGKSGAECLEEIRKHPHLKDIPVIMYSTSFDEDQLKMLYRSGADLCVRKRDDMTELRAVLDRIVGSVKKGESVSPSAQGFIRDTIVA